MAGEIIKVLDKGYYDPDCEVFIPNSKLMEWECPCRDMDEWHFVDVAYIKAETLSEMMDRIQKEKENGN